MKRYVTLMLLLGIEIGVMAQKDGFFECWKEYRFTEKEDRCEVVLLPNQHGLECNYNADDVPLASGCLLLLGIGLLYAGLKKQN